MIFWSIYGGAFLWIMALMFVLWLTSIAITNVSIVDAFWGTLFIIAVWWYFTQTKAGNETRQLLVTILATIWGVRLSLYLAWRNWGKEEDFRYQNFRQKYGATRYWWVSFFQTFLLQGVLAWLVSAPLLGAQYRGGSLNFIDGLAIVAWLIGFTFEAGGDWQLARFKANPDNKGKLLDTGFWRYTRHPNYFGDACVWWSFGLFSLAAGSFFPVLGVGLMTFLLLRISGVALLERSLKETKPAYQAYINRTNAFIPGPPKN